jgi:hypothetical protein
MKNKKLRDIGLGIIMTILVLVTFMLIVEVLTSKVYGDYCSDVLPAYDSVIAKCDTVVSKYHQLFNKTGKTCYLDSLNGVIEVREEMRAHRMKHLEDCREEKARGILPKNKQ